MSTWASIAGTCSSGRGQYRDAAQPFLARARLQVGAKVAVAHHHEAQLLAGEVIAQQRGGVEHVGLAHRAGVATTVSPTTRAVASVPATSSRSGYGAAAHFGGDAVGHDHQLVEIEALRCHVRVHMRCIEHFGLRRTDAALPDGCSPLRIHIHIG
jgi:hypothetical protein